LPYRPPRSGERLPEPRGANIYKLGARSGLIKPGSAEVLKKFVSQTRSQEIRKLNLKAPARRHDYYEANKP
jgi:hypothetical protein